MSKRKPDIATLVRQLAEAHGITVETPANDEEQIDEDALRELARKDAEQMRRARKR